MIKTLYLSGPMSGIKDYNFPAFDEAAESLRQVGYTVVSPSEGHGELPGMVPWCEYLRRDLIGLLSHAHGVALLEGWTNSQGSQIEVGVADVVGIECKLVDRWLEDCET